MKNSLMIEKETSKNNLETANDALKKELKNLKDQVEKENNSKETPKGTTEKIELRPAEKQTSNDLENFLDNAYKTESKKSTQHQPNNDQQWRNPERPPEVWDWINESSNNFTSTINEASKDKNPIARKIGERMEYLMS